MHLVSFYPPDSVYSVYSQVLKYLIKEILQTHTIVSPNIHVCVFADLDIACRNLDNICVL